jgi:hypothetical protein
MTTPIYSLIALILSSVNNSPEIWDPQAREDISMLCVLLDKPVITNGDKDVIDQVALRYATVN